MWLHSQSCDYMDGGMTLILNLMCLTLAAALIVLA